MKKVFSIILGVTAMFLFTAASLNSPKEMLKDFNNYRFLEGACYYFPANTGIKLPAIYDGYWGGADVRFGTDSASKIIHINMKNETKDIMLGNTPPDTQSQQNIIIKRKNGILKAYILSAATEEQFQKALSERKVYCYGSYRQIQDGEKPCTSCKGTGKTTYGSTSKQCYSCRGTAKTPNMLNLPEIRIVE